MRYRIRSLAIAGARLVFAKSAGQRRTPLISDNLPAMRSRNLIFPLHWLAIACSGAHSIADAVLIFGMSLAGAVVYIVLGIAAFWWWLRSLRLMARTDLRGGALGATAMAFLWGAFANGATIAYCMPPCEAGLWADVIHIGSLVFGLAAGAVTLPFVLRRRVPA